jgi:hypothetical protein
LHTILVSDGGELSIVSFQADDSERLAALDPALQK